MHPECFEFVKEVKDRFPRYFEDMRVLEIGSRDINGSVRSLFSRCDYVGLDFAAGPGVDIVSLAHEYDPGGLDPGGLFDVCLSVNTLEHDPYARLTADRMIKSLHTGGLLIVQAPSEEWPEHGTLTARGVEYGPDPEFYRPVTPATLRALFPPALFCQARYTQSWRLDGRSEVFLWGIKR